MMDHQDELCHQHHLTTFANLIKWINLVLFSISRSLKKDNLEWEDEDQFNKTKKKPPAPSWSFWQWFYNWFLFFYLLVTVIASDKEFYLSPYHFLKIKSHFLKCTVDLSAIELTFTLKFLFWWTRKKELRWKGSRPIKVFRGPQLIGVVWL